MANIWWEEIWRVTLIVVVAVLLGMLTGQYLPWFLIGSLLYLGWHLKNLSRLQQWTSHRLSGEPPESSGIWEELFLQLFRFRQRNKRRHKRLVSRLTRFQEAAQALPDAILVMDFEGTIEWCNRAATRMLAIHTTNDLGQRLLNLVRNPKLVNYLAQGEFEAPLVLASPVDETRTLSIRVVPYGEDQQLFIARDITHLQRLEQMRRDFVANVSHEMRTPLTVITGYLEMLQLEDYDKDSLHEFVERMNQQASRLQSIIGDLLLLSRLESSTEHAAYEEINVSQMLKVLLDEARSLSCEHQHDISLECEDGLVLLGNDTELRSAFSNLVFNAVRYTPDKGQIKIRWYADHEGAHFAVTDSGIGIAPQHIPRLTERFYRVDVARSRHTGGTGLGLAIVKHVLQRHEASLHIDSTPGKGSTFRCDFDSTRMRHQAA
ncbi:MAG: phosphate regulon sensor histidine kinase PhoR [Granulosicoccaceae bacterium]